MFDLGNHRGSLFRFIGCWEFASPDYSTSTRDFGLAGPRESVVLYRRWLAPVITARLHTPETRLQAKYDLCNQLYSKLKKKGSI